MTYNFLESLYNDIIKMISNIVVKREDLAKENETLDSAKAFELYKSCIDGSRYFYNFETFDTDILLKYLTPEEVREARIDRNLISEDLRSAIVNDQAERVINTYEELNGYYRMLNGQPAVDDHVYIFIHDYADIDGTVPIHKLSNTDIFHLEIRGKLDELKTQYPDKKYLNYLGINRIDIITARLAKPFEILRLGSPTNNRTEEMFRGEYYKARRYTMATIYNRRMFTTKTLYDPIIGIIMLALAIRNTLVPTEYDYLNFEEILDAILESYGLLDYFNNFPFTYKRRLTLALDKILNVKGTDGVLLDICKLFTPKNNVTVNRYYLMKTQTKDENGNINFTGDPEIDYDLHFIKADIKEHDINFTEENLIDYETVTNNDYLWQLSATEKESLLKDDFNLMMSKYIDIEASYELTELAFEVCTFINLLLYSRENLIKVRCSNMYASEGSSDVYTMIIFVLAGLARRSNFDGNIIYDPSNIAEILRFNYDDIEDELKEIIDKYELEIDVDDKLLGDYIVALEKPVGYKNAGDMVSIYVKNRELYFAILKEMETTNDIRKYTALSNAKDLLYISSSEKTSFTKSDGTYASTYYELLQDLDPKLSEKLDSCEEEYQLNNIILYGLEKLDELFNSDELNYLFLNTPTVYRTLLSKYLKMAINVFKAASVQLESINVFFYLGDHDPIRIIDKKIIHKIKYLNDNSYVYDTISTHKTITIDEIVSVGDKVYTNV